MLENENMIFGSIKICKEYDMKTNSIVNLMSEINFDEIEEFCIFISSKMIGKGMYKIFLVFSNDDKFLIADQFDMPDEELDKDVQLINYNKVYSFTKNNFPDKGLYKCELYSISQNEYNAQKENININGNQALYDFLQIDSKNLLDIAYFNIN